MKDNPFIYTLDNKRYHTFNYYLKDKYKSKVAKIPLDAKFTCPNRDGKLSTKGCIFCSDGGSGDFTDQDNIDLEAQYQTLLKVMRNKWPNCNTIPYFQAFTNTYGPLSKIKSMCEPFLLKDEVKAISIATRADCLEDDKIEYLNSLTNKKDIWIELGLQSSNDNTSNLINRGHDFKCFINCLERLKDTNLNVCIHIINSLPYESMDDMINTVKDISKYEFNAIKIHMLYIIKDTLIEYMYNTNKFHVLTKDEYIDVVIKQLELLNPKVIIQRITGDPVKEDLIEPTWLLNKTTLINDIDKEMKKRNTYQGIKYNK